MDKRLIECVKEKEVLCIFDGFEDWRSFVKIFDIISEKIKPDYSNFEGITDMHGYFDKYGLHVELEYNGMMGNFLVYRGSMDEESINTVKKWARIIFAGLMDGEGNAPEV